MIGGLLPSVGEFAPGIRPVSRQVSGENPTGAPGAGARFDPDPVDPDLRYSKHAVDLGRGFKVRPYVQLGAGDTLVLADTDGPGVINRIFITSNLPNLDDLRLQCFWDGAGEPAIDVPLGLFYCLGHAGRPYEIASIPIAVGPARGCACYWPMPFIEHARVILTNTGPIEAPIIAYSTSYALGTLKDPAPPRFHAHHRRSRASISEPDHLILDRKASGFYVGTSVAWTARSPGWWGEGEVKFFLDDDRDFPSIIDTGTEDYFGGAWGFGRDATHDPGPGLIERPFSTAFLGCPLIETDESRDRRISLYRWHLPDPIHFAARLRASVQSLGWGGDQRYRIRDDDIASVAYWYEFDDRSGREE